MKKICALICAVLMLASLAGCSLPGMSMEDLCGNWESLTYFDAQDTQEILEGLDFYPEEIALADLNGLCIVATVEFKTDKQYNYGYDVDATRAMAEQYFSDFLDTLYENREDLVEAYGETILSMSKDAFLTAYAELFGMTSGQELIEVGVAAAVGQTQDVLGVCQVGLVNIADSGDLGAVTVVEYLCVSLAAADANDANFNLCHNSRTPFLTSQSGAHPARRCPERQPHGR